MKSSHIFKKVLKQLKPTTITHIYVSWLSKKDRKIVVEGINFPLTSITAEYMFGCYPLGNTINIAHLIKNC